MERERILAVSRTELPETESNGFEVDSVALALERAQRQVEVLSKVLAIAVKRTNHFDWVDQGGKPYLTASGAEKLMPLFGISVSNTFYKKEFSKDDKGDFYFYVYRGTFSWAGSSIEAVGTCSSRDKFFAWDSKNQCYKPLSEVDEANIMKAAYSNMIVNGVTRVLGIRNLTWEQVESFGINRSKVAKVEYRSRKGNGKASVEGPSEDEMRRKIGDMLLEIAEGDKERAKSLLEAVSSFEGRDGNTVPGVSSLAELSGARLQVVYGKVKKEYELWKTNFGDE